MNLSNLKENQTQLALGLGTLCKRQSGVIDEEESLKCEGRASRIVTSVKSYSAMSSFLGTVHEGATQSIAIPPLKKTTQYGCASPVTFSERSRSDESVKIIFTTPYQRLSN